MSTVATLNAEKLQSLFEGFAGPIVPMEMSLFDALITGYASESLDKCLAKYKAQRDRAPELFETVAKVLQEGVLTPELAWDVSFGMIHRALLFGDDWENAATAFAHLALWLHLGGLPGRWDVAFEQPHALRMGRFLLPPRTRLHCEAEAGRIVITSPMDGEPPIQFRQEKGQWCCQGATALRQVEVGDCRIALLTDEALLSAKKDKQDLIQDQAGIDAMAMRLEQALLLMQAEAPMYLEWVSRTVRYLLPMRTNEDALASGSTLHFYGQIHASLTKIPLALAESLVHESSHQHFYIAARYMPIMNGVDKTWYYSPPVRADRQLDKILLAFHAFVNVLDLSRRCQHLDGPNGVYAHKNEGLITKDLDVLVVPLRETKGLSPIGRAMAQPLIDYLN